MSCKGILMVPDIKESTIIRLLETGDERCMKMMFDTYYQLLDLCTEKIGQVDADAKLAELASRGYRYYKDVEKFAKRNSFYQ